MTIFVNFFEKKSSFWQFFDRQMAIFRRVRFSPTTTDHCPQIVDQYWSDSPDVRVFSVFCLLLLIPYLSLVKSLRALAAFSAIANICYVVGLTIIFQYILDVSSYRVT